MEDLIKQASTDPDTIDTLGREDAVALRDALAAQVAEIKDGIETSEDVDADMAALEEAVDRHKRTVVRLEAIDQAAQERAAKVAELTAGIVEETPEAEEVEETPEVEAVETETEIEVEVVEPELEAVAAAAKPSLGALAKRTPKAHKPEAPRVALTASADLGAGGIADVKSLTAAFQKRNEALGSTRPSQGRTTYPIASFNTHRDDRPTVTGGDFALNDSVFSQVMRDAQSEAKRQVEAQRTGKALVAAGGFCAPAEPIYDLFSIGGRGGGVNLPVVNAPRGRVTYVASPTYEDFRTNPAWYDAVGEDYTAAEDAADTVKDVFVIDCPEASTCSVVAHPAIVQASNFQGRFYPEYIRRISDLTGVAHFHKVNSFKISALVSNAVVHNVADTNGGAYPQTFQALRFHAALMRETYRLDISTVLELAVPHWVIDALATDRIARDSTTDFAVARAAVMADINSIGLRVQELYDWAGQNLSGDQPGTTAQGNFPATADLLMWVPGSAVLLDGGMLNLGEVRDSTLNNTNNYQTFMETWEQVCFPGPAPWLLDGINICPTGGTGARETITCATGS